MALDGDFTKWMAAVDKKLLNAVGLTSMDLADMCYRDWHEDGMTPTEAARAAIAENF